MKMTKTVKTVLIPLDKKLTTWVTDTTAIFINAVSIRASMIKQGEELRKLAGKSASVALDLYKLAKPHIDAVLAPLIASGKLDKGSAYVYFSLLREYAGIAKVSGSNKGGQGKGKKAGKVGKGKVSDKGEEDKGEESNFNPLDFTASDKVIRLANILSVAFGALTGKEIVTALNMASGKFKNKISIDAMAK